MKSQAKELVDLFHTLREGKAIAEHPFTVGWCVVYYVETGDFSSYEVTMKNGGIVYGRCRYTGDIRSRKNIRKFRKMLREVRKRYGDVTSRCLT